MGKKLEFTKAEAIRDCKKIWKLVLRGDASSKSEALAQLPDLKSKYDCSMGCPLCAYTDQFEESCEKHCPYFKKYNETCCGKDVTINYRGTPRSFAKRIKEL